VVNGSKKKPSLGVAHEVPSSHFEQFARQVTQIRELFICYPTGHAFLQLLIFPGLTT